VTRRLLVGALVLAGCSSPSVRGADPVQAGREPPGTVTASYVTHDCVDSSGARWEHPERVFLVKDAEGFEFLVAADSGYDSLVIRNRFVEGSEDVFQAVLDSTAGRPVLHDYRLPRKSGAEGHMAVGFAFTESESSTGVLRAALKGAAFSCQLRKDEVSEADAGADAELDAGADAA